MLEKILSHIQVCLSMSISVAQHLSVLIVVLSCSLSFGQNTLQSIRGTPIVDGKVDDLWKSSPVAEAKQLVEKLTTIKADECPRASFRSLWDESHLYLLIDVKDHVISTSNGNPWAQDSIEVFLSPGTSHSADSAEARQQYRVSAIGELTVDGTAARKMANAKVVPMSGGYRVEMSIQMPKSTLHKNSKIAFEFQVNNDPGTGQRESITKWNHPKNDAWRTTKNYGILWLVDEEINKSELDRDAKKTGESHSTTVAYRMHRKMPTVPSWATDAIFYQIFPERFRNGDRDNDPTHASLEFPDVVPKTWKVTPWTQQWYKRAEWEKQMGDNYYDDGVFHRRLGGDLQGVIDKLDYIQQLGVNVIYFNPVFYARSLHKYDGNSFHHIDPHFGPDPDGDFALMETETSDPKTWKWTSADKLFLSLLQKARKRNIRIIIDGVFNHTGRDFFAFKDVVQRQSESPYRDWYMIKNFDDPKTEKNEFEYAGWWGVATLPEFADNETGDDLHEGPKEYIFNATARWMDPNQDGEPSDGIAGWRLDVANEVPSKFWHQWNQKVREINPEAYTVAEIWDNAADYLNECGFSATMNYHGFAFPSKGFLIDNRLSASEFGRQIVDRMRQHDASNRYALQNLFDSHDTDRLASMIVNSRHKRQYKNHEKFDYDVGERASPRHFRSYDVNRPTEEDRQILRLAALFQMTFVGAPMIYYGTECGMDGADDPDDRMPMIWPDLDYEDRTDGPYGNLKSVQKIKFNDSLHKYYQQLISLRSQSDALRKGDFKILHTNDEKSLFIFERTYLGKRVIVALNRGDADVSVDLGEYVEDSATLAKVFNSASEENVSKTSGSDRAAVVQRHSGQVWKIVK